MAKASAITTTCVCKEPPFTQWLGRREARDYNHIHQPPAVSSSNDTFWVFSQLYRIEHCQTIDDSLHSLSYCIDCKFNRDMKMHPPIYPKTFCDFNTPKSCSSYRWYILCSSEPRCCSEVGVAERLRHSQQWTSPFLHCIVGPFEQCWWSHFLNVTEMGIYTIQRVTHFLGVNTLPVNQCSKCT